MNELNITEICLWCNGTGITTTPQGIDGDLITEPCSHCEATGYLGTNSKEESYSFQDKS